MKGSARAWQELISAPDTEAKGFCVAVIRSISRAGAICDQVFEGQKGFVS